MSNQLKCLRCNGTMQFMETEKLQLGQTSLLLGDLPNLLSGGLEVGIYACNQCGKLEFFQSSSYENAIDDNGTAQIECPHCGKTHDFDYPKCPFCQL